MRWISRKLIKGAEFILYRPPLILLVLAIIFWLIGDYRSRP